MVRKLSRTASFSILGIEMDFKRKAWTIPDRVFDILDHFDVEVEVEVIRAIRFYSQWWDNHRCDDDFYVEFSSDQAKAVFYSVYNELKELNSQYFERCSAMSDNAMVGVVKRKAKEVKRKKQNRYYENHREAINSRRREKYADERGKTKRYDEKEEKVKRKRSYERLQSQADHRLQENSAIADRIIGLNNFPSLHSEKLLGNGDCKGKGGSYPQKPMHKAPIGSLSGNKAGQTGCASPVCSKAVNGNRIAGSKEEGSKAVSSKDKGINDRHCGCFESNKAVINSAIGQSATLRNAANSPPFAMLSAPHKAKEGEVLITRDFCIDLSDDVFKPCKRMDRFLKTGVEDWLIQNKLGCSVEKLWVRKLIQKFAINQGKLSTMLGVEEGD